MYTLTGSLSKHATVITSVICIRLYDVHQPRRKLTNKEGARVGIYIYQCLATAREREVSPQESNIRVTGLIIPLLSGGGWSQARSTLNIGSE